jgi:hypothetical protein
MRKLTITEADVVAGGYFGLDGRDAPVEDGPIEEVVVPGKRPKKKDPFIGFANLPSEVDDFGLAVGFLGGGGGAGGGGVIEEVVVQASKCPVPDMFAPVHMLGLGERGDAWAKCFEVMTTQELLALKKIMEQINKAVWKAKIAPANGHTSVMVDEINKALAGDRSAAGHSFGENMQSALKQLPMTQFQQLRAIFR